MDMDVLDLGIAPDLLFTTNEVEAGVSLLQDVYNELPAAPSIEQKMEEDKTQSLQQQQAGLQWLEATSDLQDLFALDEVKQVMMENEEEESTEGLIEEMETFLQTHESVEEPAAVEEVGLPLANSTFTEEETMEAEKLIDQLFKGTIQIEKEEQEVNPMEDSGFYDMSNVSQIVTEDGRNIVIFIAPPSPLLPTVVEEPLAGAAATAEQVVLSPPVSVSDSDSDWTPDSPAVVASTSRGRPAVKRKAETAVSKTKKRSPYSIQDRKERKKLQNVEAARRYRDKKKAEQNTVETEEQQLQRKNAALTAKVNEMENEAKTLMKLLKELGILKTKK